MSIERVVENAARDAAAEIFDPLDRAAYAALRAIFPAQHERAARVIGQQYGMALSAAVRAVQSAADYSADNFTNTAGVNFDVRVTQPRRTANGGLAISCNFFFPRDMPHGNALEVMRQLRDWFRDQHFDAHRADEFRAARDRLIFRFMAAEPVELSSSSEESDDEDPPNRTPPRRAAPPPPSVRERRAARVHNIARENLPRSRRRFRVRWSDRRRRAPRRYGLDD